MHTNEETTEGYLTKEQRETLRNARQSYALCAGVEYCIGTIGYRFSVADVLTAAVKSRRTFYEQFVSWHDAVVRMQFATGRAVERCAKEVEDPQHAYAMALSFFPSADALLMAMGREAKIEPIRHAHISQASVSLTYWTAVHRAPRPLPSGPEFTKALLTWYHDLRAAPVQEASAE